MITPGPNARAICLAAALCFAAAPAALAQPNPAAALSGPPAARVATPALADSVAPGEGPESERKAKLLSAIAANDAEGVILNGGSATQAATARYLSLRGPNTRIDAAEEEFITYLFRSSRFTNAQGVLAVTYGMDRSGGIEGVYRFPGIDLPGGSQSLPPIEDLEGFTPIDLLQVGELLPPGPPRTLPDIPREWLARAP